MLAIWAWLGLGMASGLELNGFINVQSPWPYTYFQGGSDWPGLCVTGHFQSPIDLNEHPSNPAQYQVVTAANSTFRPFRVYTNPVYRNNTIVMQDSRWLSLEIFDTTLIDVEGDQEIEHTLAGFRVLTPAPHPINGVRYPVGLHFPYVLRHPDGRIYQSLYFNINFQVGEYSPVMGFFIGDGDVLDVSLLFPESGIIDDYFYYVGSTYLAFQECLEPKTYVIPNYILEASQEQIDYWQDRYINNLNFSNGHGNGRDVQPLRREVVYHYVPS